MKRWVAFFLIALLALAPFGGVASGSGWVRGEIDEFNSRVYVYKDFSDGRNNFTQKAWTSAHPSIGTPPHMLESAEPYSGSSSIRAEITFAEYDWGGYMFVNGTFDPETSEARASFGEVDAGMDLSGAKRLVFHARGENGGEQVEFFLAGLGYDGFTTQPYADSSRKVSPGYVTLSSEWTRYEIDLEGYDLSRIGCGFGWVTTILANPYRKSIAFYMDEIYFEFDEPRADPVFLVSYEQVLDDTEDYVINNFAYLYDNALAAISLIASGDAKQARQIGDAICYALYNDRTYSDGRLRNAYMNGSPLNPPGWQTAEGKSFARMPGFYDAESMTWYEDSYAASTSTGNMAWALMAMCKLCEAFPEDEGYLRAAVDIAGFILERESPRGGFTGGTEGFDNQQVEVGYLSTEHNIDLIAAFNMMARLFPDEAEKYVAASLSAYEFVISMYDAQLNLFYTGTGEDGVTINDSVMPLDTNTWSLLAIYPNGDIDFEAVMQAVEDAFAVGEGYDFNDDRDGVWHEGTAQVALAYKMLGNEEKYGQIIDYLSRSRLEDGRLNAADRPGVSTGFEVAGVGGDWTYSDRAHLGATVWADLAEMGYNPFR